MPSNARLNNEGAVQRLLIPNGGIDAWMVTIGAVPRTFLASCASAHPPAPGYLPARPHEMAGVAGGIPLPVVLMLGLGFPEVTGRLHLRHPLAGTQPHWLPVGGGVTNTEESRGGEEGGRTI